MATLFAQTIIQFAPLRIFARVRDTREYSRIIRELFPKALFNEKSATSIRLFEIAWSFLSRSDKGHWTINGYHHRIGGLPAMIRPNDAQWWQLDRCNRNHRDPRTGLALPTIIKANDYYWIHNGELHRTDRDPRTGLTLPAIIETNGCWWYYNGEICRDDCDPRTGLTLPAVIDVLGYRWHRGGKLHRDDKDASGNDLPDTIDIGFEDYDFNA